MEHSQAFCMIRVSVLSPSYDDENDFVCLHAIGFSGRKLEALLKDSVRMMWLAQGYEPSYRTINRFRVHLEVKGLLRQCFVQCRCQLVQEKLIEEEVIFKVYECEDCLDCPLRWQCTKAKEGNPRRVYYNEKWEQQKETIRKQLLPVFGFLKANLRFTRMAVRGKEKVENEFGFAFMAVNL
ncbi:hypothetical protein GCM10011391_32660 [Pullulanibacillus camelliae]|uniref:Transposase DDE domain-containing protein n=1 Tax=Pullulanibacillus camelliae TaxID=1707096 RepID=A0A8J2YL98_9BACL|nr:hypothetical protein GCM10011391_32660 [Pullulanibacillus camelliae]